MSLQQIASETAVNWATTATSKIGEINAANRRIDAAEAQRTASVGATDFLGWAQEQLLSGVRDRSLDSLRERETLRIEGLSTELMDKAGPLGTKLLEAIHSSFSEAEQGQYSVLSARVTGAQAQYQDSAAPGGMFDAMEERLDSIIRNADQASWAFSAMTARAPTGNSFASSASAAVGGARGLDEAMNRLRTSVAGSSRMPGAVGTELDQMMTDTDLAPLIYGEHKQYGTDPMGEVASHMHLLQRKAEQMKEQLGKIKGRVAEINAEDETALNEALEARTVMEATKLRDLAGDDVADQLNSFWQWNQRAMAQRLKTEPVADKKKTVAATP